MNAYRVRQQFWTRALVLQHYTGADGWIDAPVTPRMLLDEFELVDPAELASLRARVAKSERRAAGQRKAYAEKKAKQ